MFRFYVLLMVSALFVFVETSAQTADNDSASVLTDSIIIETPTVDTPQVSTQTVDAPVIDIAPADVPPSDTAAVDSALIEPEELEEARPVKKLVTVDFDTMLYVRRDGNTINRDDFIECHKYFDKILLQNGDSLVVRVNRVTPADVVFFYPFSKKVNYLSRKEVKRVVKASGKELFTNKLTSEVSSNEEAKNKEPEKVILEAKDWQTVIVTKDEKDVENMVPLEKVTILYEAHKPGVNAKYLEKNVIIRLKKRVASIPASKALIVDTDYYMPYGDIPSVECVAIPYVEK